MGENTFKDFVLDQLEELEGLRSQAMFGGYGLYSYDVFFGIISKGRLYFKTNSISRSRYEKEGMRSFQPNSKQTLKNYFEVPPTQIEMKDELREWARESIGLKAMGDKT